MGGGAGTRQTRFEAGALVQNLREFYVAPKSLDDFGLDSRQSLKRGAKSDVQDRGSLAGREFGDECAVDCFATVGGAGTRELLKDLL